MVVVKHDIIILGSGLAGMRAAIEICKHEDLDVCIVSKVQLMRSHSVCAEGGTGAVVKQKMETAPNYMPGIQSVVPTFLPTRMSSAALLQKPEARYYASNIWGFPGRGDPIAD